MKTMKPLIFAFALLGLTAASNATVLIFKGTASRTRFSTTANPPANPATKVSETMFFIVNYNPTPGGSSTAYFVFASAGKKWASQNGPRTFVPTQFNGSGGSTIGILASDTISGTGIQFVRFQGKVSTVQPLSTNPITIPFPRSFAGTFNDIDNTGPVVFEFPNITVNFDKAHTQFYNNKGFDAQQTAADLVSDYLAKPHWIVGS